MTGAPPPLTPVTHPGTGSEPASDMPRIDDGCRRAAHPHPKPCPS